MRDLTRGVHAGVRTPGTNGCDRLVGNDAQSLFDALLNATPVLLALPAIVGGTVVFDSDGKSHVRMLRGVVKKMGATNDSIERKARFDPIFFRLEVNRVAAAPAAAGSHRPHRGLP